MKEFYARKMVSREFLSEADYARRLSDGSRCHFAVEGRTGATITGLGWQQALALAERFNQHHEKVAA